MAPRRAFSSLALALWLSLSPPARAQAAAPAGPRNRGPWVGFVVPVQVPFTEHMITRQARRAQLSNLPALLEHLGDRRGLSVAEVGAGTGQFTYRLAAALPAPAHILATDINPLVVDYLRHELARRGVGHVTPALVTPHGLDPVYHERRYDLVFMAHVYFYLRDRVAYLEELAPLLAVGGRVVIITSSTQPFDLTAKPEKLVELARALPQAHPIVEALAAPTRAALRDHAGTSASLAAALLHDLNRMLFDERLFRRFVVGGQLVASLALEPGVRAFAQNELDYLDLEMIPSGVPPAATNREAVTWLLNRLIVEQTFPDLFPRPPKPSWRLADDMLSAGYTFEAILPFSPSEVAEIYRAGT